MDALVLPGAFLLSIFPQSNWVRLPVSSSFLPAMTQLGQLLSCPISTSLTQQGKETRLRVLLEFYWQRADSQKLWVVHTLHIPERSLALDQFLRYNLFTLEIIFPMCVLGPCQVIYTNNVIYGGGFGPRGTSLTSGGAGD